MIKKTKIRIEILFLVILLIISAGCVKKDVKDRGKEFVRGNDGLTIEFLENYPRDNYLVSPRGEDISIVIEVRNKGAYGPESELVSGDVTPVGGSAPTGAQSAGMKFLTCILGLVEKEKNDPNSLMNRWTSFTKGYAAKFGGGGYNLDIMKKEFSDEYGKYELYLNGLSKGETPLTFQYYLYELMKQSLWSRYNKWQEAGVKGYSKDELKKLFEKEWEECKGDTLYEGQAEAIELEKKEVIKQSAQDVFVGGGVYISGFDDRIIKMGETPRDIIEKKSKSLSKLYLPAASSINPHGGIDTVEFKGKIEDENLVVDKYETTILATLCYPYATKAGPTVCVDRYPFDNRQEKVCQIGSQTLSGQGAPITVTRIDEEASTDRIQFKINIKKVGKGDVLKPGTLDKCNPLSEEVLERDDFDTIELVSVSVGGETLYGGRVSNCRPFADGSNNLIRLFNGEGFVVCTLDTSKFGQQSAFTTPLNIELKYDYRSTISKPIKISKITSIN